LSTYAAVHREFQVGQLNQLNVQLWMQQAEDQKQRYLSDVLLGVAAGADRIERTIEKDQFAAGILAHRWLQAVHWVHGSMFSDFDRKQRWQDCYRILIVARDRLWADPLLAEKANKYLCIEDNLAELRNAVGPNAKHIAEQASMQLRSQKAAYDSTRKAVPLDAAVESLIMVGVRAAARFPASLLGRAEATRAQDAAHATYLRAKLAELAQAEATGTPFIDCVRQEHPLLMNAPDAEQAVQRAPVLARHTIERQIVVVRCKYCAQLTPVDHSRCEHCGGDRPL
jgi:hypothetical protein